MTKKTIPALFVFIAICGCCLAAGDAVEPGDDLSLREVVALTLLHNPALKSQSHEIRISEAAKLQASLHPNPEVGVEVENIGIKDSVETTVMLSQLIEMGDKRRQRVRHASLGRDRAAMDYEAARLDILTTANQRFIDVLSAQRRLETTEQLVKLSEQALGAVSARVDAGRDSPIEQTRSRIALSNAKIAFTQAKQTLAASRKALANMWGASRPTFGKVIADFDDIRPVSSEEELVKLISNNPDLALWAVEIEQRRAALDLERANGKSDITVGGGVKYLEEDGETGMVVGLSIPLPFFDRNQGGRLRAATRLSQAAEQQEAARLRINTALTKAYMEMSNAYVQTIELKNNVLQNTQDLFDVSTAGYNAGKFDYLTVLDAQERLFEARLTYIDSLTAFHKARAEVERLAGHDISKTSETKESEPTQKDSQGVKSDESQN